MSDKEPSKYSIQHMPDVAREVGFLVMICANLDGWMIPALANMLRGKDAIATAIVSRVDSLSAKFEVLVDIANERAGTPMANGILKHADAARKAIAFRNKLAHGMFGFDENSNPINVPFPFSVRRGTPKPMDVSPGIIRPHIESIGKLIEAIADVSGQAFFAFPQSKSTQ